MVVVIVSRPIYASDAFSDASLDDSSSIFEIRSCFISGVGSSDHAFEDETSSSASIFLRLPLGAGSRGVRQYVTVLVTTCRTWTLPDGPPTSAGGSRGENVAFHGAALRGVELYGDGTDCAEAREGEKQDVGMCNRRGVPADRGAGLTKGDGGMITRGDSGLLLHTEAALLLATALSSLVLESQDVFRDNVG